MQFFDEMLSWKIFSVKEGAEIHPDERVILENQLAARRWSLL